MVFSQLGEAEVRRIAHGAKDLRRTPGNSVPEALGAFVTAMDRVGGDAAAGDDMLREVAARALGPELAKRAFDGVMPPPMPDEALGPVAQAGSRTTTDGRDGTQRPDP
jgi:flagellar motor switch protein FliG